MKRGFTILETMFASAILMIVILGVLNILPSASLASKRADQQMTADALAQGKLEELRSAAYASLADGSEEVTVGGTSYRVQTVVTPPPPSMGTSGVKCITVQVTWENPGDVSRLRSLRTLTAQLYVRENR